MLGDGLRRYPNDAELWFLLAEAHSRYDGDVVLGEVDDRASLAFYDHAIALDSTFAPAYVTPISTRPRISTARRVRAATSARISLAPSGPHSQFIRLADAAARSVPRGVGRRHATRRHAARRRAVRGLEVAAPHSRFRGDDRAHRAGARGPTHADSATHGLATDLRASSQAVDGLQFRGHLRDALRLASLRCTWLQPAVLYNMARVGMVPAADGARGVQAVFSRSRRKSRITKLYGWWATDGDTARDPDLHHGFERRRARLRTPSAAAMLRASVAAGRAYLALAKRDTTSALHQLLTTPDTLHECWYDNRLCTCSCSSRRGDIARRGTTRAPLAGDERVQQRLRRRHVDDGSARASSSDSAARRGRRRRLRVRRRCVADGGLRAAALRARIARGARSPAPPLIGPRLSGFPTRSRL